MPRPFSLDPDTIYLGDNGCAFCGEHAGATAAITGHDLYGTPLLAVTPEIAQEAQRQGWTVECETCRKPARLVHTSAGA